MNPTMVSIRGLRKRQSSSAVQARSKRKNPTLGHESDRGRESTSWYAMNNSRRHIATERHSPLFMCPYGG